MATLSYDANKLEYAGDFRTERINLFNSYGLVADITSLVVDIAIYEDLYSNFLSGSITFIDTDDILTKLPVTGHEYLEFKVRTPLNSKYGEGEYDFTNSKMAVFKVSRQRLNQFTIAVVLDFTSTEAIRDQNIKISRAFNGPYDDAVAKIFKKSWGLNSKKKLYIQPTNNNFKFVAPNMRPSDLMNMMASRAVSFTKSGEGGQASYLFYENGQGFHFRSLSSFYFLVKADGIGSHPDMFEYFCDSEDTRAFASPRENPISQLRTVKKHKITSMNDVIKGQRMGAFASKLITHDSYNKTYNEYDFNYINQYNQVSHMEKSETEDIEYRGLIPNAHYDFNDLEFAKQQEDGRTKYKTLADYADARIMVQSSTANIHNINAEQGFRVKEYVQKRQSMLNTFNAVEITLEVPGNTHLNIGHMIRINVPRSGGNKGIDKSSHNDKMLSGRWLITAIRHSFDVRKRNHTMILTCSKETYGQQTPIGINPINLQIQDEGNPINLFNDTEYN